MYIKLKKKKKRANWHDWRIWFHTLSLLCSLTTKESTIKYTGSSPLSRSMSPPRHGLSLFSLFIQLLGNQLSPGNVPLTKAVCRNLVLSAPGPVLHSASLGSSDLRVGSTKLSPCFTPSPHILNVQASGCVLSFSQPFFSLHAFMDQA